MEVIVTKNYGESCEAVAEKMIAVMQREPAAKLGLATGGTTEKVYPLLVKAYEAGRVSFSQITTVNLDEYIGMDPASEQSYRNYMDRLLFSKVDIDPKNTYVPSGLNDVEAEIRLFNEKLQERRPIDLQLLGVGVSGHIGFNEPREALTAGVHVEQLTESTIQANSRFFASEDEVPKESMTMGVGDIMKAKSLVLIATGKNKAAAMKALLMNDQVTTEVPVTLLKLHPAATVVIDEELAAEIGYQK